eukprot:s1_g1906.t1
MCQYSAVKGCASEWHTMHIGQFAVANPGLIMLEGTAVEPDGRISPADLCLYNDEQEEALARLVQFVKQISDAKVGIQLFHSGRKGSQQLPRLADESLPIAKGGWEVLAPSPIAFSEAYPVPLEVTHQDMERVVGAFAEAAQRAARAGIDVVELHYAHGYYLHTFLSSVSNQRSDAYGGSAEARMKHPLEVFEAVNNVLQNSTAVLGARVSGTDHGLDEDAWTLEDALSFGKELAARGCAFLDVSSGFLSPHQAIADYGPGFQVKLAEEIKQATGVPTFAVGVITGAQQANTLVSSGAVDAVALGRGMLLEPRWPWRAARELGHKPQFPIQYERAFMHGFPDMFDVSS